MRDESKPRISLRSSGLRLLFAPLHRAVTHCLDLVAVGIAQERAVIGGVIVAQARRPVVRAAGGDAGAPERIDRTASASALKGLSAANSQASKLSSQCPKLPFSPASWRAAVVGDPSRHVRNFAPPARVIQEAADGASSPHEPSDISTAPSAGGYCRLPWVSAELTFAMIGGVHEPSRMPCLPQ